MGVEVPLMIDTLDADALDARARDVSRPGDHQLHQHGERARPDRGVRAAAPSARRRRGRAHDRRGRAWRRPRPRSCAVAREIHHICVDEYGLRPEDLIFDALTFTLATGEEEWRPSRRRDASRASARSSASCPACGRRWASRTSRSASPPAPAPVLNSVFLHHAVEAGLDLAMVNPAHIVGHRRDLRRGARARRRPDLRPPPGRADALHRSTSTTHRRCRRRRPRAKFAAEPVDERIHLKILHRHRDGIEDDIDEALDQRGARENDEAVDLLNNVLLPAMKDVGDRFGAGELILPFVLQSAEVMKRAVAHLENYLDRPARARRRASSCWRPCSATCTTSARTWSARSSRTTATRCIDLGRQVPINVILDKAEQVERRRDRPVGAAGVDVEADAALPARAATRRGLDVPGARRRRGDQPLLRPADRLPGRRHAVRAAASSTARTRSRGSSVMDRLCDPEQRGGDARRAAGRGRGVPRRGRQPAAPRPAVEPSPAGAPSCRACRCRSRRSWARGPSRAIDPAAMFAAMDEKSLYKL